MPQKTRREKQAAAARRQRHNPDSPTLRTQTTDLKIHFLKDLRKSLFLVASIIALEIAVYFGTMNSYLANIFKFY